MLKDIIDRRIISVEPDAKVIDVSRQLAECDVGSVLVLTNGRPRGILTDRDIVVRCLAKNVDPGDCTAEQIMTESLETVSEDDGIFDVIRKMKSAEARRIPVVDHAGKAIGIVSFGDVLAILGQELYELTRTTTSAEDKGTGQGVRPLKASA